MISKDFVISKKSINFASHLTGSRPVKNFFNKLTAVFKEMKKDIHPKEYREVVFKDMSNDETFITRSTVASRETIEIDGKEYPLVKLEITSSSHPFLHRKAEARRHSRTCGQIPQPLRQPLKEIITSRTVK